MAETIDKLQLEIESVRNENRKFSSEFSCKEITILQQSLQAREKEVSRMSLKVKSLELALE
jgi:FtsZ-binding cell division protein ZapB